MNSQPFKSATTKRTMRTIQKQSIKQLPQSYLYMYPTAHSHSNLPLSLPHINILNNTNNSTYIKSQSYPKARKAPLKTNYRPNPYPHIPPSSKRKMSIFTFLCCSCTTRPRRNRTPRPEALHASQALLSFATLVGNGESAEGWEVPEEMGWLEDEKEW